MTAASRYREIRQVVCLLRTEADGTLRARAMATILVVVGSGVLAALSPLALKSLVDAASLLRSEGALVRCSPIWLDGAAYLGLLLAGRALNDVRPLLNSAINQHLHSRLAHRFFGHVLHLPTGYVLGRRSGELQHCLDLGSAGAQLMTTQLLGGLLPVLIELVTMTVVLCQLGQPGLVAVFGVATLCYLAIFSTGARRMAGTARAVSTCSLETYAQLGDGLANLETLRCFGAEEQALRRLQRASASLEQAWGRLNLQNVRIALAASGVFALSFASCLFIGAEAVARQTMTLGGFVLATVYSMQMVRPVESLGLATRDLSRALGSLRPLLEILAEPLADDQARVAMEAMTMRAIPLQAISVRLENLHFAYDPNRPVIKGLDLDIPAGSTLAIVGRSGSGKSSLARLLMRLYLPQRGCILLNGRNIDSINVEELRRTLVGVVPQETVLLHDSIAENIALGSPRADREDIRAAAREAQLEELIAALPGGLDTPVGERGMKLSGGERQRIGIARALLKRRGLYVLDEPTSMLDSRTELEIRKTLRSLSHQCTIIVIAHRLSSIVDADEIVVLDEGVIRERGSHEALLARDGLYAQMWRQQIVDAI